ncbi:MAG: hypothetical protein IJU45_05610 [Clostridia bacterium]|nr:hypothetical protein [Clostridia bacterium]
MKTFKKIIVIIVVAAIIIGPAYYFYYKEHKLIQSSEDPDHYYVFEDFQNYYYVNNTLNEETFDKIESSIYESPDGQFMISDYKDGICINQYLGNEKDVVIPETINGKKVIKIGGYPVFDGYVDSYSSLFSVFCKFESLEDEDLSHYYPDNIETVTLPKYLKEIHLNSFENVVKLKRIIVDENNPYYKSTMGGRRFLSKTGSHLLWASTFLSFYDISRCVDYTEILDDIP